VPTYIIELSGSDLVHDVAQIIATLKILKQLDFDIKQLAQSFHIPPAVKRRLPVELQNIFPDDKPAYSRDSNAPYNLNNSKGNNPYG